MFGFASDFAAQQTTQQLAADSATACYKKPDQHVSQVTAVRADDSPASSSIFAARACCSCARVRVGASAAAAGGEGLVVFCAEAVTCKGGQCHGAMKAMGITIGKNGQLVVSNKTTFETSNEPSRV